MKRIMLRAILVFIISSTYFIPHSHAQNATVKEYGIGLSGSNNFSLQYRWGTGSKLYRITANIGAANFTTEENSVVDNFLTDPAITYSYSKTTAPINLSGGTSFSIIHLKPVNEKFGFMYGPNAGVLYSYRNSKTEFSQYNNFSGIGRTTIETATSLRFSGGIVLGGYYKVSELFRIYAEIIPNIYYDMNSGTTTTSTRNSSGVEEGKMEGSFSAVGVSGLSNSGASITFAYRITYPLN